MSRFQSLRVSPRVGCLIYSFGVVQAVRPQFHTLNLEAGVARGDHIFCFRTLKYTHHGIDCGDGTAIHFTGEPIAKSDAEIRKISLGEFADGAEIFVVKYEPQEYVVRKRDGMVSTKVPLAPEQVVAHAYSRLGESGYSVFKNNCEHFAVWCKTGIPDCKQLTEVAKLLGEGTGTAWLVAGPARAFFPTTVADPFGWLAAVTIGAKLWRYDGAPFPWREHDGVRKMLSADSHALPPTDDLPFDFVPYE